MTWPPSCVRRNESLASHTSIRIGGPAEWFATPASLEELADLLKAARGHEIPVTMLGGGTNTLVPDRGIRGLVIHLGNAFRTIQPLEAPATSVARVHCGAALLTQRLVSTAARLGWGGIERLAGLPGQVGGAVAMNAQEIGEFVRHVRLITYDGIVRELPRESLQFRYRDAIFEPGIITDAVLEFPRVPSEDAAEHIHAVLRRRNQTQEVQLPSAGCAFKNPPGQRAGQLIDAAGLKGVRIGDAQVSMVHANFIVNLGAATCDEVLALMEHVGTLVRKRFGITLEPEVRVAGERWG